jgi:hypothetical protein
MRDSTLAIAIAEEPALRDSRENEPLQLRLAASQGGAPERIAHVVGHVVPDHAA